MSGASQAGGPRGEQPNSQSEASGEGEGESNQKSGQLTSERQQKLSESTQRLLGLGAGSGSDPLYEDGPLTGERFTEWSTRLQDVEDLLTTPQLRAQATAIRDRARRERIDVKRHSKAPDWELVRTSIYGPLLELEQQVAEELARRNSEKRLVPIDRDPVPEQYSEFVRSYYEQLSRQPIE